MLPRALLRAPRRAWRLSPPPLASLHRAQVLKAINSLSFGSARSTESEETRISRQSETRQQRTNARGEKILAALRVYKEMNGGSTLVPRSFVVPSGDTRWPHVAWGYRLGEGVSDLRQRATKRVLSSQMSTQLKELNFAFNAHQFQWDEIIMPALRHFYQVNGHTDVPTLYFVPDGDDAWPRMAWNCSLGRTVDHIRNGNGFAPQVAASEQELKQMKFCLDMPIVDRDWNKKIIPALKVFRQIHHHCIVERPFKVPRASPWPEDAWGFALGSVINRIRTGRCYAEFAARDKDILNEIGFAWDRDASTWNERVIPALQTYVAEFETCRMLQKFIVPAREPWPKSAWNMALGMPLYRMRYSGDYFACSGRDVDRLKELGYHFELTERAWMERVDPLLEIYQTIFGDKEVPRDFVIPSQAPWPEKMWGVNLGVFVERNTWS